MTKNKIYIKNVLKPALFVILGCSLLIINACNGKKDEKKADEKMRISTFVINKRVEQQRIVISGKLESSEQANLSFKIGGRIANIVYDVGDFVKKGTLMAALDQDEIAANVAQAELMYSKMKRDYERVVELSREGAATKEQLQDITTAFSNAEQQLKIARYNLILSSVKAPFDGYVALRRHEPGELIQAGDPVFVFIGRSSKLKAVSGVAGRFVSRVKPGNVVDVVSDSAPEKIFEGRITRVGMAADFVTGTFPVELEIVDRASILRPGMVVSATIPLGRTESLIMIPPESLVEADEDRGYVFTYDPATEKVRKVPVKLGGIIGDMMIVTDGLKEGDEIAREGAEYLTGGEAVIKNGSASSASRSTETKGAVQ
jgi:multidrug efflux system membrane fusion protein